MNTTFPGEEPTSETLSLLARIKAYSLPGGEDAARGVRAIKTRQRGEIRSHRAARWIAFTAEECVDATKSSFRWDARLGTGVMSVRVTDAYEGGRGRLIIRKGPVQLGKLDGPDIDQGELQRYLAYLSYCPPMLVSNPSLELTAVGPHTLRMRDRLDQTGASVDVDVTDDGRIIVTRAVRPMMVGKRAVPTPWSTMGSEPQERDGLRVPRRMEASWHPTDGAFTYVRIELTTFELVR